jgi:hypothetical protein
VDLLRSWPANLAAVVLIALHRPSDKVSNLQDVLSRATNMPVLIATQAQRLSPGNVYIGKPDEHLTLMAREAASLTDGIAHKYPKPDNRLAVGFGRPACPRARSRNRIFRFFGRWFTRACGDPRGRRRNDGFESGSQTCRHAATCDRIRWPPRLSEVRPKSEMPSKKSSSVVP